MRPFGPAVSGSGAAPLHPDGNLRNENEKKLILNLISSYDVSDLEHGE